MHFHTSHPKQGSHPSFCTEGCQPTHRLLRSRHRRMWCVAGSNPNPIEGFKNPLAPRFPSPKSCRLFGFGLFSGFISVFARPTTCVCFHSDLKPAWISVSNQSIKTHRSPRRPREPCQTLQAARLFPFSHLLQEHLQRGRGKETHV